METIIKTVSGVVGAAASFLWGGFPMLLKFLLILMVIDYLSGLLAGWVGGKLSSKTGREGIARKVLMPVLVAVAHFVDVILGTGTVFRDGMTIFYLVNEILSIVENVGRAGLPVPEKFKQAIHILREKGEKDKSEN
ncbi:holin family protein [Paenactinomyces guangxiensis]|uniref:Phage holin family protein n=1 Tax=Paenactinomyces guangxiensis TaxID=1490290 RepID=A0A7W1WS78_9BACL|nr:phage holin family protein [Paenactinomyces guangxiensis]MBA4495090.1 phage holin family protein [Paenactinomyces guangxiensis]MBH8592226.1 phage holin family protein [Paenactinomyces guangxiensis]